MSTAIRLSCRVRRAGETSRGWWVTHPCHSTAIIQRGYVECATSAATLFGYDPQGNRGRNLEGDVVEVAVVELEKLTTNGMDRARREHFFASLYGELHRMAGRELWLGRAKAAMGATTLVHEAYLNLAGRPDVAFENRAHFLTYASRMMRGLIIDRARNLSAEKRGGGIADQRLDTDLGDRLAAPEQVVGMASLLDELTTIDAELARVGGRADR